MSTCPGTCCASFPLHPSLEELYEEAATLNVPPVITKQRERIIDLIVIDRDRPGHYNCVAFDPQKGLCTAYDQRPDLCRRYPYGRPCEYCTYDDRTPDIPGYAYRPVEETGIFNPWEAQICESP